MCLSFSVSESPSEGKAELNVQSVALTSELIGKGLSKHPVHAHYAYSFRIEGAK